MPRLLLIGLALAALAGCSDSAAPLTLQERIDFYREVIEHEPECKAFRDRLDHPASSADTPEAVYQDAMKARCVKKDV